MLGAICTAWKEEKNAKNFVDKIRRVGFWDLFTFGLPSGVIYVGV